MSSSVEPITIFRTWLPHTSPTAETFAANTREQPDLFHFPRQFLGRGRVTPRHDEAFFTRIGLPGLCLTSTISHCVLSFHVSFLRQFWTQLWEGECSVHCWNVHFSHPVCNLNVLSLHLKRKVGRVVDWHQYKNRVLVMLSVRPAVWPQ